MLPSHIGNRDPGPRGFLQDPQLLVDGIPSTTLNTRINLNSFCIGRHSRMTRLTPSSYLRQHCPVEMGAAPTGKPPGRAHDGQIITIRPNLRWTSDGFEIACWNGQSVRVAFALDTCDREVMSWVATTGGISGEMIRDLMLESVERRFNDQQTPHPVEWLSDNGSCYRAHDTVSFAQSIGLVPCFTPVRSPQSNGMAESFVKTFKRDYVYVHDRPDAQSVLAQLPRWFEDYNDNHPHKALRMKSPREFIRSFHQQAANCPV